MGQIYKITNKLNNKSYIGLTRYDFWIRYNRNEQWWIAPSISKLLRFSVDKHGSENFIVEILEDNVDESLLSEKEIYWINKFNTLVPNGFNLTSGGEIGFSRSEESKKKLSNTLKEQYKNGRESFNKGRKFDSEFSRKVSEGLKKSHKEGRTVVWNKGKKTGPMSKESIDKSAKAHGKKVSCFDLDGNLIKTYSMTKLVREDGFLPEEVSRCCCGLKKVYKNFIWKRTE